MAPGRKREMRAIRRTEGLSQPTALSLSLTRSLSLSLSHLVLLVPALKVSLLFSSPSSLLPLSFFFVHLSCFLSVSCLTTGNNSAWLLLLLLRVCGAC